MSGPAKCPTCGGRLEGVEPQRLRTRGATPRGAQLCVAPCPRCGAVVPFAALKANITDLLAEVNVWTAFANHFTHFRTGEPAATEEPALMGAILADATNLGLDRMAESSRGVTIHQLNLVIERHIRPETYAAGVAAIVDAQHAEPLSAVWGTGDTSSSDGQFFPAGGHYTKVLSVYDIWNIDRTQPVNRDIGTVTPGFVGLTRA